MRPFSIADADAACLDAIHHTRARALRCPRPHGPLHRQHVGRQHGALGHAPRVMRAPSVSTATGRRLSTTPRASALAATTSASVNSSPRANARVARSRSASTCTVAIADPIRRGPAGKLMVSEYRLGRPARASGAGVTSIGPLAGVAVTPICSTRTAAPGPMREPTARAIASPTRATNAASGCAACAGPARPSETSRPRVTARITAPGC